MMYTGKVNTPFSPVTDTELLLNSEFNIPPTNINKTVAISSKPHLVIINGKVVVQESGLTEEAFNNVLSNALLDEYEIEFDKETGEQVPGQDKLIGKSKLEAGMIKLANDATKKTSTMFDIWTRLYGAPKTKSENVNVSGKLQDLLTAMPDPINITPTPSSTQPHNPSYMDIPEL